MSDVELELLPTYKGDDEPRVLLRQEVVREPSKLKRGIFGAALAGFVSVWMLTHTVETPQQKIKPVPTLPSPLKPPETIDTPNARMEDSPAGVDYKRKLQVSDAIYQCVKAREDLPIFWGTLRVWSGENKIAEIDNPVLAAGRQVKGNVDPEDYNRFIATVGYFDGPPIGIYGAPPEKQQLMSNVFFLDSEAYAYEFTAPDGKQYSPARPEEFLSQMTYRAATIRYNSDGAPAGLQLVDQTAVGLMKGFGEE